MINLVVLFGGKSVESDISILTAYGAISAVDKSKYHVFPIYIDKTGTWNYLSELTCEKDFLSVVRSSKGFKKVCFMPNDNNLYFLKTNKRYNAIAKIDVCLLCNHGTNVEDGCLQGYLESCNICYSGSGVLCSAVSMDKAIMKNLFLQNSQINVLPFKVFNAGDNLFESEFDYPCIVKPACLGSSIGISYAKNDDELKMACDLAFKFCNKIVVEKALTNFKEYNCAVFYDGENYMFSKVEQPLPKGEILSFADKYLQNIKTDNESILKIFPAKISCGLKEEIQNSLKAICNMFDVRGVARVDFLLDENDKLYVNEINSIPGALSNYLFDFSYDRLINLLIECALKQKKNKDRLTYAFKSSVLSFQNTPKNACQK